MEKLVEQNRNDFGRIIKTSMNAGSIGCYKREREGKT